MRQERQLIQLAARRPEEKDVCEAGEPTLDLYAGVGTIGLTIGGGNVTLVEINADAVREMQRNITELDRTDARAVLAPSEQAPATVSKSPPGKKCSSAVTQHPVR